MLNSISQNTLKQYNSVYKKWWEFSTNYNQNPFEYNLERVSDYLIELSEKDLSFSSVNTHKSALSFLFSFNPEDDKILKRILKGVYNKKPPTPKYESTWDPSPVLDYLKKLHPLSSLNLTQITLKLTMLLALTTGHRVQTFSSIQLENIKFLQDKIEIKISGKLKTSGKNKYQPLIILPFFAECPELCVATVLQFYIEKTKELRPSNEQFLLITYKKPYHRATSQSVSRWLKTTLQESGIDTNTFSGYSTRHASTSAAYRKGINIETIRKTAGWTHASETFNKFYNKPITQNSDAFARAVLNLNKK
ncbi:uncharacterized protein LOC122506278 [Leptopilina heterotoma]|uniref:uncharacterized protein LOC122506278 n=1 Tax=Leptopilina heterotoma TaxID=63436 RepID=UPI001CA9A5DC|nr:uncharacterized protein LOC122506278 [Leptopilina heterotoma]